MGLYHRENHQEGFLVLAGECLLLVEGEERTLKAWDFFHCPGGTAHIIVGAGDGLAVVVAVGARGGRKGLRYLVDAVALKHGAGVEEETAKPSEAYARFPRSTRTRYRDGWLRPAVAAAAGRPSLAACRPDVRARHARLTVSCVSRTCSLGACGRSRAPRHQLESSSEGQAEVFPKTEHWSPRVS